jgi:hypothetical protein
VLWDLHRMQSRLEGKAGDNKTGVLHMLSPQWQPGGSHAVHSQRAVVPPLCIAAGENLTKHSSSLKPRQNDGVDDTDVSAAPGVCRHFPIDVSFPSM